MYRSHLCNAIRKNDSGKKIILSGWVHRRRDFGGLIFIDLRDRYGITQIVSDPENFNDAHNMMDKVRSEYVIKVEGTVRVRPQDQENHNLETGEVEMLVEKLEILNKADVPPFEIDKDKDVSEEIRLKYRYLDLRRERLKNNIILRHKIIKFIRDYLDQQNFLEIETPILIKGTPEGSREYIVPSRIYPGSFYVLPQSPQQLKQLLMVAGFDKYFQIARCFRDEDQRGDRQPEFTQLDMEMSFVDVEDVIALNEGLMIEVTKKFAPDKSMQQVPFPVMTYDQAMNTYGSDKPDIRFGLPLSDVSEFVKDCGFNVFKDTLNNGGVVKALRVNDGVKFARREIDEFTEFVKIYGLKGLAYIIIENKEIKGSIAKFLSSEELENIQKACDARDGDIIFFAADKFKTACEALGQLRLEIARRFSLMDPNVFAFCWVTDFPLFEYNPEEDRMEAVHHPFTAPKNVEDLDSQEIISKAYDLVLNGNEVGGGSIRIHDEKVQKKIFDILKISEDDAERRFGHMLRAFKYGAPPHGGIAWGLDRLVMIFAGEPNIREVIPFPKDQKAKDLMLGAPSQIPQEQLDELGVKVVKKML